MTPDGFPDLDAVPMDETEIDDFLRERGYGVLALADDRGTYPVPISFGYDGERIYFAFLRTGESSKKVTAARESGRASLLAMDVDGEREWRSAIAYGGLDPLDEEDWESAVLALRDNAWHPSLFAEATPARGIDWWAMAVEEATGRRATATRG